MLTLISYEKGLSCWSVHGHENHWNHWCQESGSHVSGWALSVNTLHVDLGVSNAHFEVDWCKLVVHASEHLILGSISSIGHDSIDTAHFLELVSTTVTWVGALLSLRASWHVRWFHSICEVLVKFDSGLKHFSTLLFHVFPFDIVSISLDLDLLSFRSIFVQHIGLNWIT